MKLVKCIKCLVGLIIAINLPVWALACNGLPRHHLKMKPAIVQLMQMDTIPANSKEMPALDPVEASVLIKSVPKVRKQAVPVSVPFKIKVKPINIIKPKIIKPVIKVL